LEEALKQRQRIIFISLVQINTLDERGIYQDLLRQFVFNGHEVTIVCPVERRSGLSTRILKEGARTILQVRTLNIQKSPLWEKGLATISLNMLLQKAIKKHLASSSFELILYATPPITITGLIRWLKKRDGAKTYLLLKDIFPQNAVDMGMLGNNSFLHNHFKRQEQMLYSLSDRIGCMSPANVSYLCAKHPELQAKVEVNPNAIDLSRVKIGNMNRAEVLNKWGIPNNSVVFLYGGNLGKPQGTTFLLELLESNAIHPDAYFLIVGDGTDYPVLRTWFDKMRPKNAKIIQRLPKPDFDELAACCDVGLILLRKEFTIPNFPSRMLTYLENQMPVLAMTDTVSDVGPIAKSAGFGDWCLFGDNQAALKLIAFFCVQPERRKAMGVAGFDYMREHYDVKIGYQKITEFVQRSL
jgi:glycosyltransferase involved in cell wall biosynthesis